MADFTGTNPTRKWTVRWRIFHAAEIYLVVAILVFGLITVFLLPVSAGIDEETHLFRVWEMSAFVFIPNDALGGEMPFPAVYWEMSYRRPFIVRPVEPDFWGKYAGLAIDAHDYIYGTVGTRSVYSPPLLLPQALVMRYLGRSWQLPALTVFYAIRITGLLCYLLLAWLAIRLLPFGKWVFALLAASPVAILQASTISADVISNGIAFLFVAGTLAIVAKPELRRREWIFLALLFLILFWGKLNLVPLALLPFLLLRPAQFKARPGYVSLIIITVFLLALEVGGWSLLAYSRLSTPPPGTDPVGQIQFMLTHPLKTLSILGADIWGKWTGYFHDWLAIYGYNYWPVPIATYYLYLAGLVAALLAKPEIVPARRTRVCLLLVFVTAYAATILMMYVTFNPVGSDQIDAVQGRYFTTVMPLLFLALACLPALQRIHAPAWSIVLLAGAGLVFYTAGMYLSYYVPCGSQFYRSGLCYQPNYKNWAPDEVYSAPLSYQLTLRQEIVPECDGMTVVQVWVNAAGADPNGQTAFTLRDASQGRDAANLLIPNSELPSGDWFPLNFPADWVSNGKLYLLTMQGDPFGARIAYSLRQEYPAGKLYENDEPINRDVIFQTGCIAGWEKLRLTGAP
jgi:uncharacterized membrane protein